MTPRTYNTGQNAIIELSKAMGYRSDDSGVCAGISVVFLLFCVLGMRKEWYAIIDEIYTAKDLPHKLNRLKEQLSSTSHLRRTNLSAEDKKILNILAVLEVIEIFNHPEAYTDFFDLASITQLALDFMANYIFPDIIQKKGGICEIASWPGIYPQSDLQCYLSALNAAALNCHTDIAIMLDSLIHKICLYYDHAASLWILGDPNVPPAQEFRQKEAIGLLKPLYQAMTMEDKMLKGGIAGFATTIYALGDNRAEANKFVANLHQLKDYKSAHAMTDTRLNYQTTYGLTLAHFATYIGNTNYLGFIKIFFPFHLKKNKATEDGFTSAHLVAYTGHEAAMQILIDAGVEFDASTNHRVTPAYIAAEYGRKEILKKLKALNCNLDAPNKFGATPLFIAAQRDKDDAVRFLLSSGANVQSSCFGSVKSLKKVAKDYHVEASMNILIENKIAQRQSPASIFITPFEIATVMGHICVLKAFAETNKDIYKLTRQPMTLALIAVEQKRQDILQLLEDFGVDLSCPAPNGKTAMSPRDSVFRLFHGADKPSEKTPDPNQQTNYSV